MYRLTARLSSGEAITYRQKFDTQQEGMAVADRMKSGMASAIGFVDVDGDYVVLNGRFVLALVVEQEA